MDAPSCRLNPEVADPFQERATWCEKAAPDFSTSAALVTSLPYIRARDLGAI